MHDKTRKVLTVVAALAAAGGVTAGIAGAAKSGKRDAGQGAPPFPGHGHGDHGPQDEPELTGDAKTKAEAAALDAVPGGTVMRSSEEDPAEGTNAKYEVHVADKDGAPVRVLLDGDFKVVAKQAGPGPGMHGGPGGPDGPHQPPSPLTGDAADKAKAAALDAVSGGTVRAAFAAPPGADATYVVLVTRKDAGPVAVLLDGDFKVVRKLDRPMFGGHGGRHGHDGFRGDGPPMGPPPGAPS